MTTEMTKREHVMDKKQDGLSQDALNRELMKQQSRNFYVEMDETGEPVYHWIDTRVDMLSSCKLWSILHACEKPNSHLDLAFTDAITNELINRNDYERRPLLRIQ
jgi:hypothetical protein